MRTLPQATYVEVHDGTNSRYEKQDATGTTLLGNISNSGVLSLQNNTFEYLELTDSFGGVASGGPQVSLPAGYYGNYHGNGGTIVMDVQLGGDNSPRDQLWIKGDVTGTTNVRVVNVGGMGAQTENGIPLIYTGGTAAPEAFVLAQPVFAGAFEYNRLVYTQTPAILAAGKGTVASQSWNLVSEAYAPPRPVDPVDPPVPPVPPVDPVDPPAPPVDPVEPPVVPPAPPHRPQYQPMVPVAEMLPLILQEYNQLPGYRERRVGRTYQNPVAAPAQVFCKDASRNFRCSVTPEQSAYYEGGSGSGGFGLGGVGLWAKAEGSHSSMQPSRSTTGADFRTNRFGITAGYDANVWQSGDSRIIAGVYGKFMQGRSSIRSFYGTGNVDTQGYAVGATLTYIHANGLYLDGQLQYGHFTNDLSGIRARFASSGRNVDVNGWAASVEAGKRIALGSSLSLVPNVRLSYSSLSIGQFTDSIQAPVSFSGADSLQLRGGFNLEGLVASGQNTKTVWYVGGGVSHEFLGDPTVRFATISMRPELDTTWADALAGFNHSWSNGWSVYGNVKVATSVANFTDSYNVTGRLGLNFTW